MMQPTTTAGPGDRGAKTSSQVHWPSSDLVGTSQMVVVRETLGVACTACWSGSFPVGCTSIQVMATLLDMSDRLSIAIIS
jgi:hypothetical protein